MVDVYHDQLFDSSNDVFIEMAVYDATEKQLREVLTSLDSKSRTTARVYAGKLFLIITAAEHDRIQVMFCDKSNISAAKYLVDPGYSLEDGTINLLLGDHVEDIPIMTTVPETVAVEVAEFFRKTGGQLADSSRWKSREELFGIHTNDIDGDSP